MKELDEFILKNVDEIFHSRLIVEQTTFQPLMPGNITTRLLPLGCEGDRYLIIIKVVATKGVVYQLSNGDAYYRVNASNMRVRREKIYKEVEVNHLLHIHKMKIAHEYETLIKTLTEELRIQGQEMVAIQQKMESTSFQFEETRGLLYNKILTEKRGADEAYSSTNWATWFKKIMMCSV